MKCLHSTEFVRLASKVLRSADYYEDHLVVIDRSNDGQDLCVLKKHAAAPISTPGHLKPITIVREGAIVQHHSDHVQLSRHLIELCGEQDYR